MLGSQCVIFIFDFRYMNMDVCGDIENREMNSVLIKSEPLEDTQDKETTEETNVILITRFYILLLFLLYLSLYL